MSESITPGWWLGVGIGIIMIIVGIEYIYYEQILMGYISLHAAVVLLAPNHGKYSLAGPINLSGKRRSVFSKD